ncbi:MAG: hypothetical protein ACLU38_09020 [Dysosmobacter sp.]
MKQFAGEGVAMPPDREGGGQPDLLRPLGHRQDHRCQHHRPAGPTGPLHAERHYRVHQ